MPRKWVRAGMFHHLISDLPTDQLADTLKNFHVTPAYLQRFDAIASATNRIIPLNRKPARLSRSDVRAWISSARPRELHHRPIHGDPKINNVMIDEGSGQAIGLIDLDTVKPGLVHTTSAIV